MLNGRTTLEIARSLQKLCSVEFQEDPDTEVGKVRRSRVDPGAWIFHVYVMGDAEAGRHVLRSNVVVVTPTAAAVSGPDELAIGALLKAPVL